LITKHSNVASSGHLKGNMSINMKQGLQPRGAQAAVRRDQTDQKIAAKKNAKMLHGAVSAIDVGVASSHGALPYFQDRPGPHTHAAQSRNKDTVTRVADDDAGSHKVLHLRMKLNQTNLTNQSGGLLHKQSGLDPFEHMNHTNPEIVGHRVNHQASYQSL